jgi:hypothetical protein
MKRKPLLALGVLALCLMAAPAMADMWAAGVAGSLVYHNDVHGYLFSLASVSTVEIWTDSFDDGANLDPMLALWDSGTGALIVENDDNPWIRPADQTSWDSGIAMALAAGDYLFTVAAYDNFAVGDNIADGFLHDGEPPIPIEPDGWLTSGSGYYHVNINVVPVPGAVLLGFLGLSAGGLGLRRRA